MELTVHVPKITIVNGLFVFESVPDPFTFIKKCLSFALSQAEYMFYISHYILHFPLHALHTTLITHPLLNI